MRPSLVLVGVIAVVAAGPAGALAAPGPGGKAKPAASGSKVGTSRRAIASKGKSKASGKGKSAAQLRAEARARSRAKARSRANGRSGAVAMLDRRGREAGRRADEHRRTTTVVEGERAGTEGVAPAAPDEGPVEPRLAALREQLTAVLHDRPLGRARVGLEVMSARDGRVLFAHNPDRLFNPASNTKILSTAAAMSLLGPDHRYPTRLVGPAPDADGVVHGDVELRGSGDPSLATTDLAEIARLAAESGVRRIEGAILADSRFRDPRDAGRPTDERAIILNRNSWTVRVIPTSVGRAPLVEVEPETEYVTLRVKATTVRGKKKTRLRVDLSHDAGRLVVTVRGRVRDGATATIKRRIGDAGLLAAALVRRALLDFGVEVTGEARPGHVAAQARAGEAPPRSQAAPGAGRDDDGAVTIVEHLSEPLAVICRVSNKDSNNFVADTIFKTAGGVRFGGVPSLEKGRRLVGELMAPLGFGPSDYRVVNGSGLTHENRITPSALARLLRHLLFDLGVSPDFLASLSVGGVDGTTRGRFHGTDASGLVRAKTGTLSGVSALSGYVGDTGDVMIFSILVEGFRRPRLQAVRAAQVRMVLSMLRYLHAGEPRQHPAPIEERPHEEPPVDSEDDGDVTGAGGG